MTGKVYLVGAGPGDPGLITQKAINCLKSAEVIVYDRLGTDRLLGLAGAGAELIYVGKSSAAHTLTQGEINRVLVEKARAGKRVVRLKGGDPFVFGRGGEEAEELAAHDIPFEVIPGVTSAVAVPAYAGIPITHRDFASSFAVVTGHERPDREGTAIYWEKLATGVDTLIFLMGVKNIEHICEELVTHGRHPETPAAVIHRGASVHQRVVTGTLEDIAARTEAAGIEPPAIIVVGEVVRLRQQLAWFEQKPLLGRRILVTRSRTQASELVRALEDLGGEAVEFPLIEVQPPASYDLLDEAIGQLQSFDWVVFTSTNAVEFFLGRVMALGFDLRLLGGLRLAAVGKATARSMEEHGLRPDLIPDSYRAAALVKVLGAEGGRGERVLLPRSNLAAADLPDGLRRAGMEVVEAEAYRTFKSTRGAEAMVADLLQGGLDAVTFTSSSTVDGFMDALDRLGARPDMIPPCTVVACIGPVTAGRARERGLRVDVMPEESTIAELAADLSRYRWPLEKE